MEYVDVKIKNSCAKKMLGVSCYAVWHTHLKAIGLPEKIEFIIGEELLALLSLQLYLRAKPGVHSKEKFSQLFEKDGLAGIKKILFSFDVNFSQEKESLLQKVQAQLFFNQFNV